MTPRACRLTFWVRRISVCLIVTYGQFILPWWARAGTPPDPLPLGISTYRMAYRSNVLWAVPLRPAAPSLASAASGGGQQLSFRGFDQVSVMVFDPTNNALRINAMLSPGGIHTPSDADQVFTSIFDPTNNAIRVNCILGCGGGTTFSAAGDLAGSSTSQTVVGLQGRPVASAAPTSGQVLTWNGTSWTPTTPAPAGAQIAGDLGGTLATPRVIGLQGVAVSTTAPVAGQCLVDTSAGWGPGSCGTVTGGLLLSPSASQTIQPTSGSNITPLAIAPASGVTQTADLFDVWKDSAMTTKAVWVDASGNLNFLGNNATYGTPNQTTQSFIRLYGSTANTNLAPPYFDLEKTDGSIKSYLAPSTSINGLLCVTAGAPGGDCAAGTTLATNPMTAAGDLIVGGTPNSLGIAPPTRLALGASGTCLTSNGTAEVWGSCGGSSSWSSLTAPTANLTLNHGTNLTTFTFGALTGSPASDQFLIQDTTGNTSTGSLVHILNVGTSTARPLTVEAQNTAVTPLTVRGASGQSVDLLDVFVGTTKAFSVNSVGALTANNQLYSGGDIGPLSGTTSARIGGVNATSTSGAAGSITVKGTDDSGTGTAGNLEIVAGSATATGTNGQLQIVQPFVKGATYTVGNLECLSANNTVSDCTTTGASEENMVGVALTAVGNAAQVLIHGEATVNFDASTTASAGAFACLSTSVAAKVTVTSTACTAGQAVGILLSGVSSATSGTILLTRW